MKTIEFNLETATVYGHEKHIHVAHDAFNADVIASNEFENLKKYSALIFAGRQMDEHFSKIMHTANKKVFLFALQNDREAKKELIAKKVMSELGAKIHHDVIVYLGVNDENQFEAINDITNKKITGSIELSIDKSVIKIDSKSLQCYQNELLATKNAEIKKDGYADNFLLTIDDLDVNELLSMWMADNPRPDVPDQNDVNQALAYAMWMLESEDFVSEASGEGICYPANTHKDAILKVINSRCAHCTTALAAAYQYAEDRMDGGESQEG